MFLFNFQKSIPPKYTSEEWISLFQTHVKVHLSDGLREVLKSIKIHERASGLDIEEYFKNDRCKPVKKNIFYYEDAIQKGLKESGVDYNHIDGIVFSTNTPDYQAPGMSAYLMADLPLQRNIPHYNLTGMGCAGSLLQLNFLKDLTLAHPQKLWLACVGDFGQSFLPTLDFFKGKTLYGFSEISAMDIQPEEKKKLIEATNLFIQAYLFGDAAVCYLAAGDDWWEEHDLQPNSYAQLHHFSMLSNIDSQDILSIYFKDALAAQPEILYKRMQYHMGKEVPEIVEKYMKYLLQETSAEWDKVLLHTGSQKIIEKAARVGGWSSEKISLSHDILARYGNVTQASIPLIWEKLSRELSQEKTRVLNLSFGLGFMGALAQMTFFSKAHSHY